MKLPALPLFHRIAGHPVIVLGAGEAARPRRLVERAGGIVYDDLAQGSTRARGWPLSPTMIRRPAQATRRGRGQGARWSMSSTSLPNAISPRPR
jgi:hypothetical protein